jgi:integrase
VPKLTKRTVDQTEPGTGQIFVWDTEVAGFGLRVLPSGQRSYVIQYRARGRSRRMTLGKHGALTPQTARKMAIRHLAAVRDGADPLEARQEHSQAPTVRELADRYLSEHARVKKKPSSQEFDERTIERVIVPAFGTVKVRDVTGEDVGRLHHSLSKTPVMANRVLALLSKMFNLAERWELRPDHSNPCRHIERYREHKRQRFLSPTELARLGEALSRTEEEGAEIRAAVLAIRLLILTGARRGEILNLKWDYVDLDARRLVLPDSKTGPKIIPLNAPAVDLLSDLAEEGGSEWVIPGLRPRQPLVGLTRIWYRIRKEAKLEDVRLHDLRHSFASVAAGTGVPLLVIGRLLGHTQAVTTSRYAHLADDPLREATEKIGAQVAAALSGQREADDAQAPVPSSVPAGQRIH